jgi:hypothetical protein
MTGDNSDLELRAGLFNAGRVACNALVCVGVAGTLLAGKEYFSGGGGDMLPVAGIAALASMYGSYLCAGEVRACFAEEDIVYNKNFKK